MFIRHLTIGLVLGWSASISSAAPTAPSKHPQTFRDCAGCAEMVVIPGGSFTMGSAADDLTADALEQPSHQVSIRSFAAGKFDVSVAEWRTFARATKRPTASGCQWSGKNGPDAE